MPLDQSRLMAESDSMIDNAPEIVSTSAVAGFAYAAIVLLQAVSTWQRHQILGGAFMVFGLILIFREIRVVSTHVTDVGVSQLTWRGRIQLHWDEVTTVAKGRRSIKLAGVDGSVIFPIERFCESKAAKGYLDSHLPAHFR